MSVLNVTLLHNAFLPYNICCQTITFGLLRNNLALGKYQSQKWAEAWIMWIL